MEASITQAEKFLNEHLRQIVISGPRGSQEASKIRIRPLLLQKELKFQAEEQRGNQVFHRNMSREETMEYLRGAMSGAYRQMELQSEQGTMHVLVSKSGKQTVKIRSRAAAGVPAPEGEARLSHNRKKRYILEEGKPVPFLKDLGVMTAEGAVVHAHYDKFRQINRFLEFLEDVAPALPKEREIRIIDFGCGKSYLTFAMYYYLHELQGRDVRITGLDLKQEVIARCSALAKQYGYEKLEFLHGDIASYEGEDAVDMVVTLHACDTATDYALARAVQWGASVILSVPCCQHELNRQIRSEILEPALEYGLIRERMAALYTDAIRAQILENHGYRTQILEFIDMEHTPKNILIRAQKTGKPADNGRKLRQLLSFLHVECTLEKELGIRE